MNWLVNLFDSITTSLERHESKKYPQPDFMTPPTIAICVGHSRPVNGHPEGGAVSVDGTQEWTYNKDLAFQINAELTKSRVSSIVISSYDGVGYGAAQRWLAAHLKTLGVQLAIELHFNSSDSPAATGHEWLYWSTSTKSKALADNLHAEMCLALPDIRSRGIQPKTSADRGAEFLRGTHCPAVICEPGFGSNPNDWRTLTLQKSALARAIAQGLLSYLD
jgi:N-acetylmuramoyl-L-alanine amidase